MPQRQCGYCLKEFSTKRSDKIFCSRPCQRNAKQKRYVERNHEREKERWRRWVKENLAIVVARVVAWQRANPDKVRQRRADGRPKMRAWRQKNAERLRESGDAWRRANPDKVKAYKFISGSRRRAKELRAAGAFTIKQLHARFDYYGNRCAYCRSDGDLNVDHVIPIARGGTNWPSNLRPACAACNSSKHSSNVTEWLTTRSARNADRQTTGPRH